MEDRKTKKIRWGAIALTLVLLYFVGQFITQLGMKSPPYTIRDNTISELAVTSCGPFENPTLHQTVVACSPLHDVMNGAFIIYGTLITIGLILTYPIWPKRKLTKVALFLLILSGICIVIAGFAPGNSNLTLHTVAASIQFLAQNIGLLLLGIGIRKTHKKLGWLTIIAGSIGLVGVVMSGTPPFALLGYGGWQRVGVYPFPLWAIGIGWMILTRLKRHESPLLAIAK